MILQQERQLHAGVIHIHTPTALWIPLQGNDKGSFQIQLHQTNKVMLVYALVAIEQITPLKYAFWSMDFLMDGNPRIQCVMLQTGNPQPECDSNIASVLFILTRIEFKVCLPCCHLLHLMSILWALQIWLVLQTLLALITFMLSLIKPIPVVLPNGKSASSLFRGTIVFIDSLILYDVLLC